jgi:hypothetical protein
MYNVPIAIGLWHEHGVDVNFAEESKRCWHGWWDMEVVSKLCLTLMARLDEPLDILFKLWPPKMFQETNTDREYSLMSHFIMCLLYELVA